MRPRAAPLWALSRLLALLLAVMLSAAGAMFGACSTTAPARAGDATDGARLASRLTAAISAHDRAGFNAVFGSGAGAGQLDQLWGNTIQFAQITFVATSGQQWRVDWQVADERGVAHNLVDADVRCQGSSCRLAGLRQASGKPAPIWLVQPITVQRLGLVTVIGGQGVDPWLVPAQEAMTVVAHAQPSALFRPAATQVVELPASTSTFEQVMAATAFEFRGTGAVTWTLQAGTTGGSAAAADSAIHIVVNPDSTSALTPDARRMLLTHEAVHAATGWLAAPASGSTWVSEGLAEAIALPQSPADQARSLEHLRSACPDLPGPPSDAAFVDPGQVDYAYAWSGWQVGRLLANDPSGEVIKALWHDPSAAIPVIPGTAGACG